MLKKVEISHRTIIFTVFFLLGLWFLYFVRDIILQLFVALLLMTILEPLVAVLTRIKIPRALSVLLTYILVLGVMGGMVALIAPTLAQQTTNFINALPSYLANIGISSMVSGNLASGALTQLGAIPGEVLNFTVSIFSNIVSVVTVLVFTFYMLLTHDKLHDQAGLLFGENKKLQIGRLIRAWENKLGKWARGQLLLMFAVGLGTYIGLFLIGIPFALPLAILAGLLEIIPILGPIVAAIPAILIGFGMSPIIGLGATAVEFLVHQLEGYVLVPKIMEKSVGVSPLVVLISIAIGAKLLGIMGVIISVPFVITLQVLIKEYLIAKE
ncbi:MAG: AI-2E family transporter [Candidatus Woesebacteria bacterium]|nr:AI-2E family transporter [Candidatus Woesebacteria bacterium]